MREFCKKAPASAQKAQSPPHHVRRMADGRRVPQKRDRPAAVDDEYFDVYSRVDIHQDMLEDKSRTEAYRTAIAANASSIRGKAVLDVGCGTGILSLFAADAGARVVYAVDASKIARAARAVVASNDASGVIRVIEGDMELVELPEKVDVIISEWMGYFLVYESMVQTVLRARDRWLKPGGLMLPSRAKLHIAAFSDREVYMEKLDRVRFWNESICGKDLSALLPIAVKSELHTAVVEGLTPQNQATRSECVLDIDMATARVADLKSWKAGFRLPVIMGGAVHGFFAFFDVVFETPRKRKRRRVSEDAKTPIPRARSDGRVVLGTSPYDEPTHWGQTCFLFDSPILLHQDDAIRGKLSVSQNKSNERCLDVVLQWKSEFHNMTRWPIEKRGTETQTVSKRFIID